MIDHFKNISLKVYLLKAYIVISFSGILQQDQLNKFMH